MKESHQAELAQIKPKTKAERIQEFQESKKPILENLIRSSNQQKKCKVNPEIVRSPNQLLVDIVPGGCEQTKKSEKFKKIHQELIALEYSP